MKRQTWTGEVGERYGKQMYVDRGKPEVTISGEITHEEEVFNNPNEWGAVPWLRNPAPVESLCLAVAEGHMMNQSPDPTAHYSNLGRCSKIPLRGECIGSHKRDPLVGPLSLPVSEGQVAVRVLIPSDTAQARDWCTKPTLRGEYVGSQMRNPLARPLCLVVVVRQMHQRLHSLISQSSNSFPPYL